MFGRANPREERKARPCEVGHLCPRVGRDLGAGEDRGALHVDHRRDESRQVHQRPDLVLLGADGDVALPVVEMGEPIRKESRSVEEVEKQVPDGGLALCILAGGLGVGTNQSDLLVKVDPRQGVLGVGQGENVAQVGHERRLVLPFVHRPPSGLCLGAPLGDDLGENRDHGLLVPERRIKGRDGLGDKITDDPEGLEGVRLGGHHPRVRGTSTCLKVVVVVVKVTILVGKKVLRIDDVVLPLAHSDVPGVVGGEVGPVAVSARTARVALARGDDDRVEHQVDVGEVLVQSMGETRDVLGSGINGSSKRHQSGAKFFIRRGRGRSGRRSLGRNGGT